jgi:hypothetical protein
MIAFLAYGMLLFTFLGFFLRAIDRWSIKNVVKSKPGSRAPRRYKQSKKPVACNCDKRSSSEPSEFAKWMFDSRTRQGFGLIFGFHCLMNFIGGHGMAGVWSAAWFWVLLLFVPYVTERASSMMGTDTAFSRYAARCHGIAGIFLAPILHFFLWPWTPTFS